MTKYTEIQLKWQQVNSIICDGLCPSSCEYLLQGYESDYGSWRECHLIRDGLDPEFCPLYEDAEEELDRANESYIIAIEEDL